jgi:hypothetical protein
MSALRILLRKKNARLSDADAIATTQKRQVTILSPDWGTRENPELTCMLAYAYIERHDEIPFVLRRAIRKCRVFTPSDGRKRRSPQLGGNQSGTRKGRIKAPDLERVSLPHALQSLRLSPAPSWRFSQESMDQGFIVFTIAFGVGFFATLLVVANKPIKK